jgi:hypothetical protein
MVCLVIAMTSGRCVRACWPAKVSCCIVGFDKAPARSTLSDANTNRSFLVFATIYEELLKQYHSFISDSRLKGLSIRNLKVIDSSTIQLFSEILHGVGRNTKDGSKKKGGIKVHAMMDAFSGVTEFVRMTEAREHDRKFLYHLNLQPTVGWYLIRRTQFITSLPNGRMKKSGL